MGCILKLQVPQHQLFVYLLEQPDSAGLSATVCSIYDGWSACRKRIEIDGLISFHIELS